MRTFNATILKTGLELCCDIVYVHSFCPRVGHADLHYAIDLARGRCPGSLWMADHPCTCHLASGGTTYGADWHAAAREARWKRRACSGGMRSMTLLAQATGLTRDRRPARPATI